MIETPRFTLRPLGPEHVDGYADLLADPAVRPFVVEDGPVVREDVPAQIDRKMREREDGTGLTLAITRDERFLGYVALHGMSGPTVAVSYAVLPAEQRRGVAGEALRAVLDHVATLGHDEIEARTHHGNEASVRLLTALGFVERDESDSPPRRIFRWRSGGNG